VEILVESAAILVFHGAVVAWKGKITHNCVRELAEEMGTGKPASPRSALQVCVFGCGRLGAMRTGEVCGSGPASIIT